jgi:hypothetical protein
MIIQILKTESFGASLGSAKGDVLYQISMRKWWSVGCIYTEIDISGKPYGLQHPFVLHAKKTLLAECNVITHTTYTSHRLGLNVA